MVDGAGPARTIGLSFSIFSLVDIDQKGCCSTPDTTPDTDEMWLFHYDDNDVLKFDWYLEPPEDYAVLSHRWREPEELLFKDIGGFLNGDLADSSGAMKVRSFVATALRLHLRFFWVDTCCINKDSSAELQEAFNSMWSWFENANFCFAYLDDVRSSSQPEDDGDGSVADDSSNDLGNSMPSEIRCYLDEKKDMCKPLRRREDDTKEYLFQREDGRPSEWFERIWTLQELIAPRQVFFYDRNWQFIGSRWNLAATLAKVTGIAERVLSCAVDLEHYSIAQRMSWAAGRKATRKEDVAYSLLGIFSVNMTPLYGEGQRAFKRLQEEIIKHSADQSIFTWEPDDDKKHPEYYSDILSPSPDFFAKSGDIVPWGFSPSKSHEMTNIGLNIELPIVAKSPDSENMLLKSRDERLHETHTGAVLSCRSLSEPAKIIVLRVASARFENGPENAKNFVLAGRTARARTFKYNPRRLLLINASKRINVLQPSQGDPDENPRQFRLGHSDLKLLSISWSAPTWIHSISQNLEG